MKKIINGFRYDTGKAEVLGISGKGYRGEPDYWTATLYRTPRAGRFFLVGEGNFLSRFNSCVGNVLSKQPYETRIIPISRQEAFTFMRYFFPSEVELIENYFQTQK